MESQDDLTEELEGFIDNFNEEEIYDEDDIPMLIDKNDMIVYQTFDNEDGVWDFIYDNNIKKLYSYARINNNSRIYYKLGYQK